jgi:hypothetical protein
LLPKLLPKMRQGLSLIDYPPLKTSAFFAVLIGLHQLALRSPAKAGAPVKESNAGLMAVDQDGESDLWLASKEAQASGFMALAPTENNMPGSSDGPGQAREHDGETPSDDEFRVGVWVEMLNEKVWTRTQLTWTNPKGNMFLFTSANGATQSMTRRSRDQMLLANTMRLVSGQHVLDDALNAVARTALHNSMDLMS